MDIFHFLEGDFDQQLALDPVQDALDSLQLPCFCAVCFGLLKHSDSLSAYPQVCLKNSCAF